MWCFVDYAITYVYNWAIVYTIVNKTPKTIVFSKDVKFFENTVDDHNNNIENVNDWIMYVEYNTNVNCNNDMTYESVEKVENPTLEEIR